MRCITSILDLFTTAAHRELKPNLVFQLMAAMRAERLWPIWPYGADHAPPRSLQDQLASFSSLEIPTIVADRDTAYEPPSPPANKRNIWDVMERSLYGEQEPSPWIRTPETRTCDVTDHKVPTLRTLLNLSKRLEDLCVGLCLDCLKGHEVCRLPHPDPWVAYRESSRLWLEPQSLGDRQETNAGWIAHTASEASWPSLNNGL